MKKLVAFSLAELLLALAIVGIVSALTIPNIRKSFQKKEITAKATKTVHVIDTAVGLLVRENGSLEVISRSANSTSARSAAFLQKLLPYLKISNYCGATSSSTTCFSTSEPSDPYNLVQETVNSKTGFYPQYPNLDKCPSDTSTTATSTCTIKTAPGASNSNCATAVINDGVAIAYCDMLNYRTVCKTTNAGDETVFCPIGVMYFDINGPSTLNPAIGVNQFFGFVDDEGFADTYDTISALKN